MFTARDRRRLRDSLVEAARHDPGITAAALVGSAASGAEDDWSDIDLALRLVASGEPLTSAREWTATMYDRHGAVHHLDIWAGPALNRVFLLESSLQVDLSFWPDAEFRATEPTFRLLFGTANEPSDPSSPRVDQVAGMGWLYALHARAAIARNRPWQALLMLDGIRDQIVVLACMRHGLDAHHGRGVDRLPASELEALEPTRARDRSQGTAPIADGVAGRADRRDQRARSGPRRAPHRSGADSWGAGLGRVAAAPGGWCRSQPARCSRSASSVRRSTATGPRVVGSPDSGHAGQVEPTPVGEFALLADGSP